MTKLERKLKATLQRLSLAPEQKVLIGASGGADSMALLDAMSRLRLQENWLGEICCAHVNHMLRGSESDAEEKLVEYWAADWSQANKLKLPTFVTHVNVATRAREAGQNLEAVARQVRYDFFGQVARQHNVPLVFTAHTFDDQSETLLMRWVRGTGATGVRGIQEQRVLCEGAMLVRPFLEVTRAEVLEHCAHYGVPYRTDSSNLSAEFTRNRVRQQLLPLLREFNPQFEAALQRSAMHWQTDANYLDGQADLLWAHAAKNEQLLISELVSAHQALRMRVLRAWVTEQRGNALQLTASHWQALERLVISGQSGRTIQFPEGGRVTREFDRLRWWQAAENAIPVPLTVRLIVGKPQVFGKYEITLHPPLDEQEIERLRRGSAHTVALGESVAAAGLWLRAREVGDAYVPAGRTSPIKLKNLLIRQRIPLLQRVTHPLLVTTAGEIIWSPGLPLAAPFQKSPSDQHVVWVTALERCNLSPMRGVLSSEET